eukprot:jgi/Bigna1/83285/fgenesh1_pg.105_\
MEPETRHWISLILVSVAMIFGIVAYTGADGDVGWSVVDYKIEQNVFGQTYTTEIYTRLGLLKYKSRVERSHGDTSTDTVSYNDNDEKDGCTKSARIWISISYDTGFASQCSLYFPYLGSFCDDCADTGSGVVSMLTFAFVALIIASVFIVIRKNDAQSGTNGIFKKIVTSGSCIAAAVFFFICWSSWLGGCQEKVIKFYEDQEDQDQQKGADGTTPSTGFAMSFVSMLFAGLAGLNELCITHMAS